MKVFQKPQIACTVKIRVASQKLRSLLKTA